MFADYFRVRDETTLQRRILSLPLISICSLQPGQAWILMARTFSDTLFPRDEIR